MTLLDADAPAAAGMGDLLTVSLGYLSQHQGELLEEVRKGLTVRLVDMRDRSVAGYLALQPPPEVALTDAGDRDRFRARVKVREIDGMSTAELAELLGRTPAAIRQSRHRARARVATAGASS
jgi:hypothetical protein